MAGDNNAGESGSVIRFQGPRPCVTALPTMNGTNRMRSRHKGGGNDDDAGGEAAEGNCVGEDRVKEEEEEVADQARQAINGIIM